MAGTGEWNHTVVPTAAEDHPSTGSPPASAPARRIPFRFDPQRQVAMHPGHGRRRLAVDVAVEQVLGVGLAAGVGVAGCPPMPTPPLFCGFGPRQAVVAVGVAADQLAFLSTAAVSGSAGKNELIASSATVTSSGMPKVATVCKKTSSRP